MLYSHNLIFKAPSSTTGNGLQENSIIEIDESQNGNKPKFILFTDTLNNCFYLIFKAPSSTTGNGLQENSIIEIDESQNGNKPKFILFTDTLNNCLFF